MRPTVETAQEAIQRIAKERAAKKEPPKTRKVLRRSWYVSPGLSGALHRLRQEKDA